MIIEIARVIDRRITNVFASVAAVSDFRVKMMELTEQRMRDRERENPWLKSDKTLESRMGELIVSISERPGYQKAGSDAASVAEIIAGNLLLVSSQLTRGRWRLGLGMGGMVVLGAVAIKENNKRAKGLG